jgi:hypothetical protein
MKTTTYPPPPFPPEERENMGYLLRNGMKAADPVVRCNLHPLRSLIIAVPLGTGTPWMEPTSGWRVNEAWNLPRNISDGSFGIGKALEEFLGVGVPRI